jgi:PPK2 family polyphosphate:nucleotide phosphotransferase
MTRSAFIAKYRIEQGKKFDLKDFDPGDTAGLDIDKGEAKDMLRDDVKRLADLQERLYAEDRWALLVIFQAMDAAGKDSAIKHVMSGVNPQGCQVHSFKQPSAQELDHDFLWRTTKALPERGRIGVFNRSYYEEVLVVRVHPEFLKGQKLPARLVTDKLWEQRFEDIRDFERHMTRNGTKILKFFLHVSKGEQRKRFLDRIEEPAKRWKFSLGDVAERALWDRYMEAYEDAIRNTASPDAPWFVVPADHKWFTRLVVARAMAEALEALDLKFPKVEGPALLELEKARKELLAEAAADARKKN